MGRLSGGDAASIIDGRGAPVGGVPILRLDGITKAFGANQALGGVSFAVAPGTVHGLVGENGAGKSTLGKIISGVIRPDGGTLSIGGAPVTFGSPADALRAGVTIMQQELSLALDLTVCENVLLGQLPSRAGVVSRRAMRRRFAELLERSGFELDGGAIAGELSLAKQQETEILRALARGARLIVMDEPTSSLAADEAAKLHAIVRSLRADGISIVYVSHFLEEVLMLSDDVTIMRNGERVETVAAAAATVETLVVGMLGGGRDASFPPRPAPAADAPPVLEVRDLRWPGQPDGTDLVVRAGEVLGLVGLVGSGRSELAHALFGATRERVTGEVRIDGRAIALAAPGAALRAGISLLPESRKDQGLFLGLSQAQNATMTHLSDYSTLGCVRRGSERRAAAAQLAAMGVHPVDMDGEVGILSGGNQQKVLFAKALMRTPRVLILDEPTRGVDVGARRAIYELVTQFVAEGMAVILISSEYDEVVNLSQRVCVMREGRIVTEFDAAKASHDAVLAAAFGVAQRNPLLEDAA
jgi:ABC-type sugar transport system ATPase subunit